MDQLEKNQVVMKEDMTVVKAQMGQLMQAMQALARGQEEVRQDNMRVFVANHVVAIMLVNPLGGVGTAVVAQPPLKRGPMYQNVMQTFNIPVSGRA